MHAPKFIKLIHHVIVSATLFGGLASFIFMVFLSNGSTSSVGAFLLVFMVGLCYTLFASVLSIWWATYVFIKTRKA